jgi:hypothetical protein
MRRQYERSFEEDHSVGKAKEKLSYPVLQEYISQFSKHSLFHELDKFALWDFTSPDIMIEHKSINKNLSQETTVMINSHKVWRSPVERGLGKRCFFAFRAIDGLYIIEYNTKQFRDYEEVSMKLKDRCDYEEKLEDKLYIPVSHLTLLQTFDTELNFIADN